MPSATLWVMHSYRGDLKFQGFQSAVFWRNCSSTELQTEASSRTYSAPENRKLRIVSLIGQTFLSIVSCRGVSDQSSSIRLFGFPIASIWAGLSDCGFLHTPRPYLGCQNNECCYSRVVLSRIIVQHTPRPVFKAH